MNPASALGSPRTLAVWALLGYAALSLFFAFFDWLLPDGFGLLQRSANAHFTDLIVMAMPIVAIQLAFRVSPALPGGRLIAGVALLEYAFMVFFGGLSLLLGLGEVLGAPSGIHDAMGELGYLVLGIGRLVLAAIAGLAALRCYTSSGGRMPTISFGPATPTPPPPAA